MSFCIGGGMSNYFSVDSLQRDICSGNRLPEGIPDQTLDGVRFAFFNYLFILFGSRACLRAACGIGAKRRKKRRPYHGMLNHCVPPKKDDHPVTGAVLGDLLEVCRWTARSSGKNVDGTECDGEVLHLFDRGISQS